MQTTTFSTEKINFIDRIKKNLIAKIIVLFFLTSILLISGKTYKDDYTDIAVITLIFAVFLIIIIPFIKSKKYIHKIIIENEILKIFGMTYNKEWNVSLNISNVEIELIEHKNRSGISNFLLVFKSDKKEYTLNRLENWNNFTLHELYTMFKKVKQEKIILDEKFVLDELEKKARNEYEWKKD